MVQNAVPGSEAAFLLIDVTRLWRRAFETGLASIDIDLSPSQVRVLIYVAQNSGLRQRQLADIMSIAPMSLSPALDALEQADLIRRKVDPVDRRAFQISLAPKSSGVLEAIAPVATQTYERAMDGFSSAEKSALTRTLRLMRRNLTD